MITNSYLKKRIFLIFICSLFPFLLTVLFHEQFYAVMDVPSYLIFHNMAEFFSVVVSFSIFGVGWYAYEQTNNRHILFLSTAFLVIGALDFFHALGYSGMPAFITPNTPVKSTQYWIAARLFMAFTFLGSAFVYPNTQRLWLSKIVLMTGCFIIPTLAFMGITFFPEQMPVTIVEGVGLTPFKRNSEYLIIALLCISIFIYWRRILKTDERHLIYFLSAFVVCIFSEVAFSGYKSVFDTYNVLGHIYKVVAFHLIYLGLFAVSVKNPYLELATTNKQLQEEIAERIKIEQALKNYQDSLEGLVVERTSELEKAKVVAESANNAKSMFLSNMSHELRTPMNAILGLVFILEKRDLSDDDKLLLHKIHVAGQSLLGIISDVLDISKIEAGKLELEVTVFDLYDVLDNLATIMSLNASEKNIDLMIYPPLGVPINGLKGDSLRLQQVLVNLVGNAIKFVQYGHIDVNITVLEHNEHNVYLHFSVADTGVGIPIDVQEAIFTSFTQADNSTTRRYGGTGLGLAISRQLVELMGGRLSLASEVGKGSEFSFDLRFDYIEIDDAISKTIRVNKQDGLQKHISKEVQLKRLEGRRLLIVDDSEINLEVASRIFGAEGALIVTVDDGQKAVEWLENHPDEIDLVLMDIQMPIMDGYEATRLIRKIPTLANLPVIALSAGVLKSQIETAREVGINDFISKPFDVEVAVNLIHKLARQISIEEPVKPENETTSLFEKSPIPEFQFSGIDVEMALKIWDDTTVYQRYLLKFSTDCETHIDTMNNATSNELARLAHKITGTSRMLGLIDIGNAAAELDYLAQDGINTDDAIERLKQAIATANHSITQYIAEQNTANSMTETKPFDSTAVAELLILVLQGIEQDSPDGLVTVLDELNGYLTEKNLEPLKLALDSFDFPVAKSEVIKLANEFNISVGIYYA